MCILYRYQLFSSLLLRLPPRFYWFCLFIIFLSTSNLVQIQNKIFGFVFNLLWKTTVGFNYNYYQVCGKIRYYYLTKCFSKSRETEKRIPVQKSFLLYFLVCYFYFCSVFISGYGLISAFLPPRSGSASSKRIYPDPGNLSMMRFNADLDSNKSLPDPTCAVLLGLKTGALWHDSKIHTCIVEYRYNFLKCSKHKI